MQNYTKFNNFKKATVNKIHNTTSAKKVIKESAINVTGIEIGGNKIRVLKLDPEFIPIDNRQRQYMEITQTTRIWTLELENDWYSEKAEKLWQSVSKILSKDVNKNQNNLTIGRRKKIREIKNDKIFKVHQFDKGSGFVIVKKDETIKKIEETNWEAKYNSLWSNNNLIKQVSERTS